MTKHTLLIIGAGGHGRSVAEAAIAGGEFAVIGFLDDGAGANPGEIWGIPILGTTAELHESRVQADAAIVAIGNNKLRETLMARLVECGFELATVIHPSAIVSPRATIGQGTAVMAGAIIGTEARLGRGVIVNSGAVVDHHAVVEDFGHLGVKACMAGGAVLGRAAWIQAGSALGYNVRVEAGAVLFPGTALA